MVKKKESTILVEEKKQIEEKNLGIVGSGVAVKQVRDTGKRRRIVLVSLVLVLLVFGLKIWKQEDWSFDRALLVAIGASIIAYLGLAWALRFEISETGWLTVLPQPAIFVMGVVLFFEMFFFQQFERIYEGVVFGLLLAGFVIVIVLVFLTANILNVAKVRDIPLIQAAQTSSYLISLLSVYVVSFSLISSGLGIFDVVLMMFGTCWLIVYVHLSHFSIGENLVRWYSAGIAWAAVSVGAALLLWPLEALFVSLIPAVIVYVGIGLVMHKLKKLLGLQIYLEYIIVLVLVLLIILLRANWGIGGRFWM
ncbi:MAG: hypothetical protein U9Q67_00145 [Patescibacteria group bacterium]|nr:hypothetical protein [Patescibacteria group bacterium]